MKNKAKILSSIFLIIGLNACGGIGAVPPKIEPLKFNSKIMEITMTPTYFGWCAPVAGASGFDYRSDFRRYKFTVKNLTNKAIEIDWNKSKYTIDGISISGLAPQGTKYKDISGPKQSSFIFPNDRFSTSLTPDNSVFFLNAPSGGVWQYECLNKFKELDNKSYGINLVYKIDGKEKYMRIKSK